MINKADPIWPTRVNENVGVKSPDFLGPWMTAPPLSVATDALTEPYVHCAIKPNINLR